MLELPETSHEGPRGPLGSDVLSHFGVFTLDYVNEVLVLEPRD